MGAIKLLSPRIYGDMTDARALMKDWNSVAKQTHWPPLTLPIVLLIVSDQASRGAHGVALGFLLAFGALLRVGELCALRVCDVVFPEDPRFWGVDYVILILQHTKTGDDKSAELRLGWVWPWLRRWVQTRKQEVGERGLLFPAPAVFRAALAESCRALGVVNAGFVMHSHRAGGALFLINLGISFDEILRRGRWRRPESARPYVQRLRALAAYTSISAPLLERGARLAEAPGLVLQWLW
jgi:integrase